MSKKNLDEVRAHLTGEIARLTQELLNCQNTLRLESQNTQQVSNDLKRVKLDLSKWRNEHNWLGSQRSATTSRHNCHEQGKSQAKFVLPKIYSVFGRFIVEFKSGSETS